MAYSWEELKDMYRPNFADVHFGRLEADAEKCNGCGLCVQNCLTRAWVMEDSVPVMQEDYPCFSCFNCIAACPTNAISIVEPDHIDSGFYKMGPWPLRRPLQPRDASGNPDKWTEVERIVFNRRSVRNYSSKPVPEHLIRRVLEAGRHAPTAGNGQPMKFVVITDPTLIKEMNDASEAVVKFILDAYLDDEIVKTFADQYDPGSILTGPGIWDPHVIFAGCEKSVLLGHNPVLLGAPVVILLLADYRAPGGPQMQTGICGQNMVLAAHSLGLSSCWCGFITTLNSVPGFPEKLGIEPPYALANSVVLGYPKFKQSGPVPRNYKPVIWWREGHDGPEIEEVPDIPEVTDAKDVTR